MIRFFLLLIVFSIGGIAAKSQKITTIPFEQLYGGVILLKAQVGDKKDTLNFIFDTGSSHISLDSATAAYLNLPVEQTQNMVSGIGGTRKVKQAKGLDFKVGDLTVPKLDFNINDYQILSESSGMQIDGIVGYAFISRYILAVNFDSSFIQVYPRGEYKYPKKGYLWKYRLDNIPNTNFDLKDNRRINISNYIDCGAGLGLLISQQFVNDSSIFSRNKKILETQIEGVGGKTSTKITTMKELKFGPYKFRNVPTYVYDDVYDVLKYPGNAGLVGNDILRRFNWVLNYAKREMHLTPNSALNESFDYSYTGLTIYLIDGVLKITDIVPKSTGEKAGLKVDDVLISIDNNIVTTVKQAKDLLQAENRTVKVIVMRNGKATELNLKIQSIL
jgi:Aspartyl protease/PDZ domain